MARHTDLSLFESPAANAHPPFAIWRNEFAVAQVSQTNPSPTQQVPEDMKVVDLREFFPA
jgi:hypothetical protein